jgi:hypothetical protein
MEAAVVAVPPLHAAGAFDQIGETADDALVNALPVDRCGQRLRELQPFLSVVVAVREEVLVDEHAQARAHGAGCEHHHQREQSGEQERDLDGASPVAAEDAHEVPRAGDDEQVQTRQQQRRGPEHDAARDRHIDGPVAIARRRDQNERQRERMHQSASAPQLRIDRTQQQTIGEHEQIEGEDRRETDAQRLHGPTALSGRGPQQLLAQHQSRDRRGEPGADDDPRQLFRGLAGHPVRRHRAERQRNEDQGGDDGNAPSHQDTDPVPAGRQQGGEEVEPGAIAQCVGQTMHEPGCGRWCGKGCDAAQLPGGTRHDRDQEAPRCRGPAPSQQQLRGESHEAEGAERVAGNGQRCRGSVHRAT